MLVQRSGVDEDRGRFQYYVWVKPNSAPDRDSNVFSRLQVEAAVSVSENGELTDLTFQIPKTIRKQEALTFIEQQQNASCVEQRVFIAFPGISGDSVFSTPVNLEFDSAGRIVGVEVC